MCDHCDTCERITWRKLTQHAAFTLPVNQDGLVCSLCAYTKGSNAVVFRVTTLGGQRIMHALLVDSRRHGTACNRAVQPCVQIAASGLQVREVCSWTCRRLSAQCFLVWLVRSYFVSSPTRIEHSCSTFKHGLLLQCLSTRSKSNLATLCILRNILHRRISTTQQTWSVGPMASSPFVPVSRMFNSRQNARSPRSGTQAFPPPFHGSAVLRYAREYRRCLALVALASSIA